MSTIRADHGMNNGQWCMKDKEANIYGLITICFDLYPTENTCLLNTEDAMIAR
jgi:hypothetical protein